MSRELLWDGIYNARDLGGLPTMARSTALAGSTTLAGSTQYGRFFRTPALEALTATGWDHLVAAGVRTIIDLRNDFELTASARPTSVATHYLPIEDQLDQEFMADWGTKLGSPVYYAENLRRWPDKIAAVFSAMAAAPPGGIVFHCAAGRDRTGLITALLLDLADVPAEVVADDYELSVHAYNAHLLTMSSPREHPLSAGLLDNRIRENRQHLLEFLGKIETADFLQTHGLSVSEIACLRDRLTRI